MYEAKKKQRNLQLLDIQACNSASKPSFQNRTSACPILKRWFNNRVKLSTKLSRSAVFASCIAHILNNVFSIFPDVTYYDMPLCFAVP